MGNDDINPQELHKDILDFILAGTKTPQTIQGQNGLEIVEVIDPEIAYWMTRSVNASTFARFVYKLKLLEGMAEQTAYNMSIPRAEALTKEIMTQVNAYKRSIDSKSSESILDRQNRQSNFIDKFVNARSERVYTVRGNVKSGIGAALLGNDVENDT